MRELEQLVGKFIITFGGVESLIRTTLISVPINFSGNDNQNEKFIELIRTTFIDNDSIFLNLEQLRKTVDVFVKIENKSNWFEIIDELKSISKYRNIIVHGIWGKNLDNEIIKPKKKTFEKVLVKEDDLKEYTDKLETIYSQLIDFIEFGKRLDESSEIKKLKV